MTQRIAIMQNARHCFHGNHFRVINSNAHIIIHVELNEMEIIFSRNTKSNIFK